MKLLRLYNCFQFKVYTFLGRNTQAKPSVFVPVKVSDSDNLSSYVIVESVHRAGVDEAIPYPQPSLYNLLDLSLDLDIRNKDTEVRHVR